MNELVVIGKGASYPCFVKQDDIIKEYEIVLDKFRAPRIKVEPHHYMTVKVIKGNKGERKMN